MSIERTKALAFLGAHAQRDADLQHIFTSVDFARASNEDVVVDSVWTPHPFVIARNVRKGKALPPMECGLIDDAKALELTDIELARFRVADEYIDDRERAIRENLLSAGLLTSDYEIGSEGARLGMADMMRRMGGIAVVEGTLSGVSIALGYYNDLRLLNHPPKA